MRFILDVVLALLFLPLFIALALLAGGVFMLVGGIASAVVAAWPIVLYYHDRFLLAVIPPSWTLNFIRRVQAYVDFHSDPNAD